MVSKLAPTVVGILGFVVTAQALDLTPMAGFRDLEGTRIPVVLFEDGERTFSYEPPPGWKVSGSPRTLDFKPDHPLWTARWLLVGETSGRGGGKKSMEVLALADVPGTARDVATVATRTNTFILEGIGSHEVVVEYTAGNRMYRRTTIFLDLDEKRQLQVKVTAPVESFNEAFEAMRRSFYSIVWE